MFYSERMVRLPNDNSTALEDTQFMFKSQRPNKKKKKKWTNFKNWAIKYKLKISVYLSHLKTDTEFFLQSENWYSRKNAKLVLLHKRVLIIFCLYVISDHDFSQLPFL